MYNISFTNRFKKDLKLCQKRDLDLSHIQEAISILAETGSLPAQYRVWEQNDKELNLLFLYTGIHSDLFK